MTVFIQKGAAPLSVRQAVKRGQRLFNAQMPSYQREGAVLTSDPDYLAFAGQWLTDNDVNGENNLFNGKLAKYRQAVKRLEKVRLKLGRDAFDTEVWMGELDPETGDQVTETVTTPAIEPLPAQVEQIDENGDAVMIDNPAIVKDEAERAKAQAVIDATPQDVKDFEA